jgi:glycosyltransferase involved in cell wall biosynthesis
MADLAARVRAELSQAVPVQSFVRNRSIAVLLPCYNEAATIAHVVEGFRTALPGALIYVYDNNSTDGTAAAAAKAGAIVRFEPYQGKGNVVRRMFADIDADVLVLADGDMTYDPAHAGRLIDVLISENLDMVVGARVSEEASAYRAGHRLGNQVFTGIVRKLFGQGFTDIFSGYRVFSRRFAKSFPAGSTGFEIETELAVHALDLKLACRELPILYGSRPQGSHSKLDTYRDGARILRRIARMFRTLHPLRFYGGCAGVLALSALVLGFPLVVTYLQTGLVPRLPTAVLAMGLVQLAMLAGACGLILEEIAASRREIKRLRYLELPSPAGGR